MKKLSALFLCFFVLAFSAFALIPDNTPMEIDPINPEPSIASAKVDDGMVKIGGNVNVPEKLSTKQAVAVGGNVTVAGKVKEDAVAVGGNVYLKDSAVVNGDAVSIGGKVIKERGAVVKGKTVMAKVPLLVPALGIILAGDMIQWLIFARMVSSLGFIVLAMALVALFTPQIGRVSSLIEKKPLANFGWGVLFSLLLIPFTLLLIVSLIGIVFIPLWILLVIAAGLVGYVSASHVLGKKFLSALKIKGKPMMWETVVGIVLLMVIGWVPVLGGLAQMILCACGFGAVGISRFGNR